MRNAATFDDDLDYASVPRERAPRKPRAASAAAKKKKGPRRPRFDMHRVARVAAIGMAATMALGIMVNALVLQKGHHPAPLFGKAPGAAAASAVLPRPVVHAAQVDAPLAVTPVAPTAKARKSVVASRDADEPVGDDAIGRLLAGGAPAKASGKGEAKSDGKTTMGVQRALTKLGFKVPPTGTAGPATKKAIEAFEKDRHMAVKGEVDRRLVKVLAAESGIKID